MKRLLSLIILISSFSCFAEVGDTTPISAQQIVEIKQEKSITSKGKEKTEILVIYKDSNNKKKLAYMTASDYKKLQQAQKYDIDVEYILVEMKSKVKLTIK